MTESDPKRPLPKRSARRSVLLHLADSISCPPSLREAREKQFVMIRESAIEQRPAPRSAKMVFAQGRERGGVGMPTLLTDLLLFSVLAAWVTGIVIAIASLLS
jgi:hypothetical protein